MIKHLLIRNYALIEHLEMNPSGALNVITGETGAGKSIMLGALGLLLGNRADKKALFNQDNKCVIEGTFQVDDFGLEALFEENDLDYSPECIIRREITSAGKSRAFINDTPATLETLRKVGRELVDIHSQHDTLLLSESAFQLNVIDQYAGNKELLVDYQKAFARYRKELKKLERLSAEVKDINKEHDYNLFILKELEGASVNPGELAELEQQLEILENSEEIKNTFLQAVAIADESEYSVSEGLTSLLTELKQVKGYSSRYEELFERVNSLQIELNDLVEEFRNIESNIEVNPGELEEKRGRTDLLNRLLQKHQAGNEEDLLKLLDEVSAKVSKVENFDEELQEAEKAVQQTLGRVQELAEKLSNRRKAVFKPVAATLMELLKKVGISDATIDIQSEDTAPGGYGRDKINLLFSANKGVTPQPLKNVASGGEFSRLMFCIKFILAERKVMPTMVFDEIDTGVSGEIALRMIRLMKEMAARHQIISISHLPQFAAGADYHYFVFKDNTASRTISKMKKLSEEERVDHIAKMIGGDSPTVSSVRSARELLTQN